MEQDARFLIAPREGRIEISGSEEFVKEQIEAFKDYILESFQTAPSSQIQSTNGDKSESRISSDGHDDLPTKYEDIIAGYDGEIKILKTLPGSGKAERTTNAALLYLLGKDLLLDEKEASFEEIRNLCKEHACYDSNNFASTLRKAKRNNNKLFMLKGASRSPKQILRLTQPGKRVAEELIDQLSEQ